MSQTIDAIEVIDILAQEIASVLRADPYFNDIPVIVADEGDVRAEMERRSAAVTARGGKTGVAVIVLEMEADDNNPARPYGPMELKPAVQVVEQVEINKSTVGTGKSAAKVARRIRDALKLFTPMGLSKNLIPDDPCIVPVTFELKGYKGRQVNFRALEDDLEEVSKVATPQIAPSSGAAPQSVTVTCATPDAVIYYTVDGSHPWAGTLEDKSTATLYSGPIQITAATLLRVRAFKAGSFGSNTNIANFT